VSECQEFNQKLQEFDPSEPRELAELQRHAAACPKCARVLEREMRTLATLRGFDRAVHPRDLTKAIVTRAREAGSIGAMPWWQQLLGRLVPAGGARLAFGMVATLIVAVVITVGQFTRTPHVVPAPTGSTWECVMLAGEGLVNNARIMSSLFPVKLDNGAKLQVMAGGIARLVLPERAAAKMASGRVRAAPSGLWLDTGQLDLEVQPIAPDHPFVVHTPLASVTVIGTRFSLNLDERELVVTVDAGRVRLTTPRQTLEVAPHMVATVDACGMIRATMQTNPATTPSSQPAQIPATGRPEVPNSAE